MHDDIAQEHCQVYSAEIETEMAKTYAANDVYYFIAVFAFEYSINAVLCTIPTVRNQDVPALLFRPKKYLV